MRILYVGAARAEAQAIATAVNSLGQGTTVSWTSGLDRVASWIEENEGVRVLVVEAQPNGRLWRSVLTYTRGLSASVPVVLIVPDDLASDLQPLAVDAHECVARNSSLLRELPSIITRAIDRAQQRQPDHTRRADLELKLVEATATIQNAEERHRSAIAAAAEELAKSRSQHEMEMARAAVTREMVNEQFREAAIEVERVRLRHASVVADVQRLVRREAELLLQIDSAVKTQTDLERRLVDAETALHAQEARAAEERRSVADLMAERQRNFEGEISEEVDKRRGVEDMLAEARSAATAAEKRHASAMSAATMRSREQQSALNAARHQLESKASHLNALATSNAELTEANVRATRELAAASAHAAERDAELEERLRQERAARAELEKEMRDEQQRHEVALATTVAELADRQAHRDRLMAQLRELEDARDQARREQQSAVTDIARLTQREADLERRLTEEHDARTVVEQEVTRVAAELRDEQNRHRAAVTTAAAELAERQAHFDREYADAAAMRDGLTAQLRDMEEARDQARREQQSAVAEVKRLTERETDLERRLEEERQTRDALEQQIVRMAAERRDEQKRLSAQLREMEEARAQAGLEQQSADAEVKRLTERETDLERRLKEERETRDALEQQVTRTAAELRDEQERHGAARAAAAAELAQRQAHFDNERAETETKCGALTTQLREVEAAREHAAAAVLEKSAELDEQRREHESRLAEAQDVISTLIRERLVLQESLHATQQHFQQLTAERQEIERRFEEATNEYAAVVAARDSDIEGLRISLAAGRQQLEVTTRQREVLQAGADQVPGLQQELQKSRADNHRLFQQAPVPMFRCTKDGVLTQANRMMTVLVGRRSPDELRGADWAAAVFESPTDLSWLIERCLGSRGKEFTETAWRRKDGSRLLVRLSACVTSSDVIEVGVEDLTPIRVLNDRLGQAHRMEAVGRLATEVAVTCGSLLGGVHENVQQFLMSEGGSLGRHRGDMLLEEISRATGLLRQLAAYGEEESRKPATVELRTVVRDIAPILKRVAGDGVEVQLPTPSVPLNVDTGAERVQRLLVNLAAYGRERMPLGGKLKIELGTIVVDRHFTAKHPHVRLGPHALVTVTESRHATRPEGLLPLHDDQSDAGSQGVAVQTRVDVGALQELVGECGGHLWMTVQPLGDMVVKIRLPLVTSYGESPRRTSAAGARVRTLGHWFQN